MSDTRRWLLRHIIPAGSGYDRAPWVEVTQEAWVQAERMSGFRGQRGGEPATESFTSPTGLTGRIYYGREALPAGTVELEGEAPAGTEPVETRYEWGTRWGWAAGASGRTLTAPAGDAEDAARAWVEQLRALYGPEHVVLIRRRVEVYDWEEVE